MPEEERRSVPGPEIAMIFQDALSSLNPVFTVGWQIGEMFRVHEGMSKKDARARPIELMERVRIPAAKERVKALPAPVLRRHAPAHHDRDGDRARPRRADRRRAHHRPRRHRPGPDHGAARGAPARAQHGADPDHPRPRRRRRRRGQDRGDVRGPDRRAGRVDDLYAARPTRTPRACSTRSRAWTRRARSCPRSRACRRTCMRIPPGCAFNPRCPYAQDICREDRPPLLEVARGRESAPATSPRRCSSIG